MAIADKNVQPAVIIHIEKAATPSQVLCVRTEARRESPVLKICITKVVVERRSVSSKIGFDKVKIAIKVVIACRNAHASLRFAIRTQSASRFNGNVGKLSIFLVLIKSAWGGVIRHINVG